MKKFHVVMVVASIAGEVTSMWVLGKVNTLPEAYALRKKEEALEGYNDAFPIWVLTEEEYNEL